MGAIAYPLRVLIVDDDTKQSDALAKLLKLKIAPAKLEMFFASTVEGGIRMANELTPCIVFLDLIFPESAWQETAAKIPEFKGAVVVVTELDTPEVEMECRARTALTVFAKAKIPALIDILIHVVTNIRLNSLARNDIAREGLTNGCS